MEIRTLIREWYLRNRRPLPWRETGDPYRIWVSEIMLQQTRISQGTGYYMRFIERFPDLKSLADAEESEVLKAWEGLGYYSRARNMHAAARHICNDRKGIFPRSYSGMLDLKGVGPYTAAAVSSISFAEPRAAVDGNIHRVLSRLFGIEEAPGGYTASSEILRKAEELLDTGDPGTHNQALMELGALVCKSSRPDCGSCPLQSHCVALRDGRIENLPVRAGKIKKRKRYFHYLVISGSHGITIRPRTKKDIWQGLYEFPLIETKRPVSGSALMNSHKWEEIMGPGIRAAAVQGPVKQALSHQEIHAKFYRISGGSSPELPGTIRVPLSELNSYPLPKLILDYLLK